MGAKKILVSVPSAREDGVFLASLLNLLSLMITKYRIDLLIIKNQTLPDAQNKTVEYLLANDFDYVLFLDDDHSGHTLEMVNKLVEADADMATMKTYIRHFPYVCALFKWYDSEENDYHSIEKDSGTFEIDMSGFPMTLIKRSVFERLEKPYFQGIISNGRNWNTDVPFCTKIKKLGMKIVGCFDYCLNHGDITLENVQDRRNNVDDPWINRYSRFIKNLDKNIDYQNELKRRAA